MIYNIQPVQIPVNDPQNLGQISYVEGTKITFSFNYQPFEAPAPYGYTILDAQGTIIYNGISALSEAVLSQWGSDDAYIINAMASNIGVTII